MAWLPFQKLHLLRLVCCNSRKCCKSRSGLIQTYSLSNTQMENYFGSFFHFFYLDHLILHPSSYPSWYGYLSPGLGAQTWPLTFVPGNHNEVPLQVCWLRIQCRVRSATKAGLLLFFIRMLNVDWIHIGILWLITIRM